MQKKAEIAIAKRAIEEIMCSNRSGTIKSILEKIGISKSTYYDWVCDNKVPNTRALQALALSGFDVNYILTGRRKNNE